MITTMPLTLRQSLFRVPGSKDKDVWRPHPRAPKVYQDGRHSLNLFFNAQIYNFLVFISPRKYTQVLGSMNCSECALATSYKLSWPSPPQPHAMKISRRGICEQFKPSTI